MREWAAAVMLMFLAGTASADGRADWAHPYFGGGLATNSVNNAAGKTALQLFAGVPLRDSCRSGFCLAAEAGYQDTSDTKADALWGTLVVTREVAPYISLLGRAGAAVGDYGSLLAGIGVDYELERDTSVRLELVRRNGVQSLQLNVVYYPWLR